MERECKISQSRDCIKGQTNYFARKDGWLLESVTTEK